jgi:sugar lactone lactonase YvrE/type II secretory pathway pseudopilin PulG
LKKQHKRFFIRVLCILCGLAAPVSAQTEDEVLQALDAMQAANAFRLGIESYNRASFNEAILSFEQSLSANPGDPLTLDWLGRAYYRSGLIDIALRQWQAALNLYGAETPQAVLLRNRMEMTRARSNVILSGDANPVEERYVESGVLVGTNGNVVMYRGPTSVLPNPDGSMWVLCYGSNELVRLDVNGIVRDRKRGNITAGFDRPYDMARGLDGRLYVTEFRSGRVSVLSPAGDWLSYIGEKGIGAGQFVSPGSVTVDEAGYLYVADYGNARVSKWSPDGEFVLSFGKQSGEFPGFLAPTGVAAADGLVYAADNSRGCV